MLIISEEIEELFEVTDRLHVIHGGVLSPALMTADVAPNDVGEYMIGKHNTGTEGTPHAV